MTVTANILGHPIEYSYVQKRYVFVDNKELVEGSNRSCAKCGCYPTSEGHDACLGKLPGVKNACCGHGYKEYGYVMWKDNVITHL